MIRLTWQHLKTAYIRSKKIGASGSCTNKKKEYKYFILMSFLDDTNESRKSHLMANFDDLSPSSSTSHLPTLERQPKKMKKDEDLEQTILMERCVQILKMRVIQLIADECIDYGIE